MEKKNADSGGAGFSEVTRDPERIGRVLRERLGQIRLSQPICALSLRAESPGHLARADGSLFGERAAEESAWLCCSKGCKPEWGRAGFRLALVADHRPERSSQPAAGEKIDTCQSSNRAPGDSSTPMLVVAEPEALPEIAGAPHRGGPLVLLTGPERIESGWWDAGRS
ncbi:MAG: hypothetical protein IPO00_17290 [Betaproteobacteria bacterium]|nr:hypothetical protein [Betaproteobacteria bacterium]